MKYFVNMLCVLLVVGAACQIAPADWYVPMADQEIGGFDYIQILMTSPYQFDWPGMSAFFGLDSEDNLVPAGEQWGQMFLSVNRNYAYASGPNLGDDLLVFSVWIDGDRQVDRPIFHYQTYKEANLVGNWDIVNIGPGELDWEVRPGTWTVDRPFPWMPGDTDCDGDVDATDLATLGMNWSPSPPPGRKTWSQGDFDGDGDVDATDLAALGMNWAPGGYGDDWNGDGDAGIDDTQLWQLNYTGQDVPEPGMMILMATGLSLLLKRKRVPMHIGDAPARRQVA